MIGKTDYVLIKDFSLTQGDRFQVKGMAQHYPLETSSVATGSAIFLYHRQSAPELIAIVQGDALTDLNDGFNFV